MHDHKRLEQNMVKWICKKTPYYITSDNQKYTCPCITCLVRANCTDKCEEGMEYIRIILNDYCGRILKKEKDESL